MYRDIKAHRGKTLSYMLSEPCPSIYCGYRRNYQGKFSYDTLVFYFINWNAITYFLSGVSVIVNSVFRISSTTATVSTEQGKVDIRARTKPPCA